MIPTDRQYPDVLTSAALLPDLTDANFSEPCQSLGTDAVYTGKARNDCTCPIKWILLPLLDSHKKTGQAARHNRLICIQ